VRIGTTKLACEATRFASEYVAETGLSLVSINFDLALSAAVLLEGPLSAGQYPPRVNRAGTSPASRRWRRTRGGSPGHERGGQGNHLPGAYATATRRALGSRHRSSALAQEKTGEFWVAGRVLGAHTRADFEHCDVALFLGKNPWHSHSIPRARVTLKEIARDPLRTLMVVDPRRTETAEIADIHLQVRPGTDAFLLATMLAVIVTEGMADRSFLDAHAMDVEPVFVALAAVSIAACSARAVMIPRVSGCSEWSLDLYCNHRRLLACVTPDVTPEEPARVNPAHADAVEKQTQARAAMHATWRIDAVVDEVFDELSGHAAEIVELSTPGARDPRRSRTSWPPC
jgi:anaerobic selenocysteine-containing dehydrogenase